jgi:hypothetical protein
MKYSCLKEKISSLKEALEKNNSCLKVDKQQLKNVFIECQNEFERVISVKKESEDVNNYIEELVNSLNKNYMSLTSVFERKGFAMVQQSKLISEFSKDLFESSTKLNKYCQRKIELEEIFGEEEIEKKISLKDEFEHVQTMYKENFENQVFEVTTEKLTSSEETVSDRLIVPSIFINNSDNKAPVTEVSKKRTFFKRK